jgi:endonuclease/exonuclease/phosphatase (EEP) superfamily protein YafD
LQPEQIEAAQAAVKRRRLWIGRAGCMLGLAAGLCGLLLGRMSYLWIAFDIFAQFTVQFMLLTLAFLTGLILPRAKVAFALVMFVGLLAAYGAWPLLGQDNLLSARAGAPAAGSLKVLSFNTWLANSSPQGIAAEVGRIDADVVTLVELDPNNKQLLAALKTRYPYSADCSGGEHCAFAILSKHPIESASKQMIWEGPPYMHAVLGGEFAGLNVFAVHTTRFPHSRAQFRQMKALSGLLQRTAGPKLVMGDFNATPYSRMTGLLESEVGLNRFTSLPSWPAFAGIPQLAIDHVFASEGIAEVEAPRLGDASGSDHFPVYMRLAVPAAALQRQ